MELTLFEALGHMCILKDEEKAEEEGKHFDRFINFLSMLRSRAPKSKEEQRETQEYFDELKSKLPAPPAPKYEWDFDLLEKYAAKQNVDLEKEG